MSTPTEPQTEPVEQEKTPFLKQRRTLIILLVLLLVVFAVVAYAFAWKLATGKPLTEMPGVTQNNPPSYSYSINQVNSPLGVAVDTSNDRLYVTQSGGDRSVLVFKTNGEPLGKLQYPKTTKASTPVYLAVNTNGDVYVTDRGTSKLEVFNKDGKYVREFKPEGVEAWQPLAVAFDQAGNLLVSDLSEGKVRILRVDPNGKILTTIGEADKLSFPNGIAAGPDDKYIAVSDSNNGRVMFYSTDGKLLGAASHGPDASSMGLPRGTFVDDTGRLFIVDTSGQVVNVFQPGDGLPEADYQFGEEGTIEGTFEYPNGITGDTHSKLYIADRANNRVQVWSY